MKIASRTYIESHPFPRIRADSIRITNQRSWRTSPICSFPSRCAAHRRRFHPDVHPTTADSRQTRRKTRIFPVTAAPRNTITRARKRIRRRRFCCRHPFPSSDRRAVTAQMAVFPRTPAPTSNRSGTRARVRPRAPWPSRSPACHSGAQHLVGDPVGSRDLVTASRLRVCFSTDSKSGSTPSRTRTTVATRLPQRSSGTPMTIAS